MASNFYNTDFAAVTITFCLGLQRCHNIFKKWNTYTTANRYRSFSPDGTGLIQDCSSVSGFGVLVLLFKLLCWGISYKFVGWESTQDHVSGLKEKDLFCLFWPAHSLLSHRFQYGGSDLQTQFFKMLFSIDASRSLQDILGKVPKRILYWSSCFSIAWMSILKGMLRQSILSGDPKQLAVCSGFSTPKYYQQGPRSRKRLTLYGSQRPVSCTAASVSQGDDSNAKAAKVVGGQGRSWIALFTPLSDPAANSKLVALCLG